MESEIKEELTSPFLNYSVVQTNGAMCTLREIKRLFTDLVQSRTNLYTIGTERLCTEHWPKIFLGNCQCNQFHQASGRG